MTRGYGDKIRHGDTETRRRGEKDSLLFAVSPRPRISVSPRHFLSVFLCLCGSGILFFNIFQSSSGYAQEQQQQQPLLQQRKSLEEERLAIIKADIQKQIEYNEKLKKEIEAAQKTIDNNARERLMKVSKIYEAMPADEAAKRLEKLDEDTAVDILSVLKPRAAGGILGEMDNDKAASISKKIINKGKNLQEKTSP